MCSLRAAPEDPILTDDQWAQIAGELMHGMGLAPYGDHGAVRWVAVRHADDHIHIVTTLAREDGTRPDIWRDYDRVMNACRTIEARHGLRVAPAGDRTAPKAAGRAETEKAIRLGRADPPKDVIKRLVSTVAAGARSESEFFERLAESGVLVRQRHSKDRSGRAEGYAVTLSGHTDASGEPIWYGGHRLAADLSLPKLRARWPEPGLRVAGDRPTDRAMSGPMAGERLSARTAQAVLRMTVADAADRSADEGEFFGRLTDRGLVLRVRYSEVNPGEVTGYAVALPGRTRPDGQPDWCGGSHLADRLSLQKLRERWGSVRSYDQSSAERFTFEERQAMYDDAARAAACATDQIRRFGRFDPARAADAAWAASDVLHTAAKALGNPHLRAAADAYDRAAREPYAKIPPPTSAGNTLRTIARIFALVGLVEDRTSRILLQFLTQLTALVDAVVELRALQHRDAQASAAARASRHLPGRDSQARPAGEAVAFMRLASADFPMDITESLQMQQATIDQRQPSRGPSPGRSRPPGR